MGNCASSESIWPTLIGALAGAAIGGGGMLLIGSSGKCCGIAACIGALLGGLVAAFASELLNVVSSLNTTIGPYVYQALILWECAYELVTQCMPLSTQKPRVILGVFIAGLLSPFVDRLVNIIHASICNTIGIPALLESLVRTVVHTLINATLGIKTQFEMILKDFLATLKVAYSTTLQRQQERRERNSLSEASGESTAETIIGVQIEGMIRYRYFMLCSFS